MPDIPNTFYTWRELVYLFYNQIKHKMLHINGKYILQQV